MDLNLFNDRKNSNDFINKNSGFINAFIDELKNALKHNVNENNNISNECKLNKVNNVLEEYNLYEKRKIFLDNKTKWGNNLAWIMDENSVCISEHGDGGPISINEIKLPHNKKIGYVYEEINGRYIYNEEITLEINSIEK